MRSNAVMGVPRLIVGTAMVALISLGGTSAQASEQQLPTYVEAAQQLAAVRDRLMSALAEGALSLERRQNQNQQMDWTRQHMRNVRDLLTEDPPMIPLLERAREAVKGLPAFPLAGKAIGNAIENLRLAGDEVNKAIAAKSEADVMTHARLAQGMLSAAVGRPDSNTPAIGSLSYAISIVNIWLMPINPSPSPNVPTQ